MNSENGQNAQFCVEEGPKHEQEPALTLLLSTVEQIAWEKILRPMIVISVHVQVSFKLIYNKKFHFELSHLENG